MNCIVAPNEQIARNIEAWNLYCKYNQAWIEMYLAYATLWIPKR
jgi:hypothetical protein